MIEFKKGVLITSDEEVERELNQIKDIVCLNNYADFPDNVKEDSLLRLTNIEAPYKITVPQRWIDDYLNITV